MQESDVSYHLIVGYPKKKLSGSREFSPEDSIMDVIDGFTKAWDIPKQRGRTYFLLDTRGNHYSWTDPRSLGSIWPRGTSSISPGALELVVIREKSRLWKLIGTSLGIFFSLVGVLYFSFALYRGFFGNKTNYGAVFDAGSAHTTLSVYKWNHSHFRVSPQDIQETMTCANFDNAGVSSYVEHPKRVRKYFTHSECFNKSRLIVPKSSKVFVGATAGMRILNASKPNIASAIMSNISFALNTFANSNASILDGVDEGLYGWITVNYLSRAISSGKTLGALDWGGASSQITFEYDDLFEAYDAHSRRVSILGKDYSVYVRSDLCYGRYEATKRYLLGLLFAYYSRNSKIPAQVRSPCHTKGFRFNLKHSLGAHSFNSPCINFKDADFLKIAKASDPKIIGTGDFEMCRNIVSKAFNFTLCNSVFTKYCMDPQAIPDLTDNKYVAFSTYFYLLESYGSIPFNKSRLDYLGSLKNICELPNNASLISSNQNACLEGTFMYYLLKEGYHITNNWEDRINVVKRIRDGEVGWTLGYIIHESDKDDNSFTLSLPVFFLLMLCLCLLLFIGCFFSFHSHFLRGPTTTYDQLAAFRKSLE